jgi:hypothetical protein
MDLTRTLATAVVAFNRRRLVIVAQRKIWPAHG